MRQFKKSDVTMPAVALLLAFGNTSQAYAEQCESNFAIEGNFLSGKTFMTFAEIQNASPDNAFQGAYQVVLKEGWKIQQVNKVSRTISALNRDSANSGKSVPLNVTVEPSANGAKISIQYSTPVGLVSPEGAVKDQFCKIVAAAASQPAGEAKAEPGKTPSYIDSATLTAQRISQPPDTKPNLQVDGAHLCLAKACLGMTVEQAAALNLEPAGTFKFSFNKGIGDTYGIDANGQRVWFSGGGDFDNKTIAQFAQKVRKVCAVNFVSAQMKASDGQPIRLVFRPTIRDGKGRLVLTQIDRHLPGNLSASERKNFEQEARERYGDAFVADISDGIGMKRPSVMVHYSTGLGYSLRLAMPFENVRNQLMEQPGCSDKPRLD